MKKYEDINEICHIFDKKKVKHIYVCINIKIGIDKILLKYESISRRRQKIIQI